MLNKILFFPNLFDQNRTGPFESNLIKIIIKKTSGKINKRNENEKNISKILLINRFNFFPLTKHMFLLFFLVVSQDYL